MRIESITKDALVLRPSNDDNPYTRSWCFSVGIIPDHPTPRKVIIRRKVGRYVQSWEMSWRKFLRQTAIGDMALIDKSAFTYSTKQTRRARNGKAKITK